MIHVELTASKAPGNKCEMVTCVQGDTKLEVSGLTS